MNIATYNVWNSDRGMPNREKYIINEIMNIKADIICLQEVHSKAMADKVAQRIGYPYYFFDNYKDEQEGLCILSKIPFIECESWLNKTNAIYCSFLCNNKILSVVNLHLPWDSAAGREKQIVNIINAVDNKKYDYIYMAGDYNCADTSDVHRFLMGDCLLNAKESKPCWYDLALAHAELNNMKAECTLNFRQNPRFENNTIELNARFDRILIRNTYPNEFPILRDCTVFGKTVYEDIGLAASDHYGVVVNMVIKE